MFTSSKGRDFITRNEGEERFAYLDIAGNWTIGRGHTSKELNRCVDLAAKGKTFISPWFHVEPDPESDVNRVAISSENAELLLAKDLEGVDAVINGVFQGWQKQHEHDACADFLFNVGVAAFNPKYNPNTAKRARMVADKLEISFEHDAIRAAILRPLADAFLWWNKATVGGEKVEVRGLTRRRIEDAELLLYGDYEMRDDGIVNAPGMRIGDYKKA